MLLVEMARKYGNTGMKSLPGMPMAAIIRA